MSRVKKLLIVSFVLALGIGLAWPFRRNTTQPIPEKRNDLPSAALNDSITFNGLPAIGPSRGADLSASSQKHIVAKMASTGDDVSAEPSSKGFDLKDHAALANQPINATVAGDSSLSRSSQKSSSAKTPPTETPTSRPAYSTSPITPADETAWPEEVVHIVRNGDTLEKLAERYLGDAGRALELFDLNREQLANPHLLPIDAELRIPVPVRRESD